MLHDEGGEGAERSENESCVRNVTVRVGTGAEQGQMGLCIQRMACLRYLWPMVRLWPMAYGAPCG
eukprot:733374-Prymnesium_polylepis.1